MAKAKETEIEIPAEQDPTRWTFARARKLRNEAAQISADIRDVLKEAKGRGANVAALRLASRLARMTPEKRKSWEDTINAAAAHFGYSKLEVVDMPAGKNYRPHAEFLERIVDLEHDKKKKSDAARETYSAAKDAGVDVDAVRLFVRMAASKDATEITDWYDGIGIAGEAIGVISGDGETDLSDDEI